MISNDGGGGLIPCSVGYWEMTPPEFVDYIPPSQDEIELHRKSNEDYFQKGEY